MVKTYPVATTDTEILLIVSMSTRGEEAGIRFPTKEIVTIGSSTHFQMRIAPVFVAVRTTSPLWLIFVI